MEPFQYAKLFVKFARFIAIVVLAGSAIVGFGSGTFTGMMLAFLGGLLYAFLVLVGADLIECFLKIESNTRPARRDEAEV